MTLATTATLGALAPRVFEAACFDFALADLLLAAVVDAVDDLAASFLRLLAWGDEPLLLADGAADDRVRFAVSARVPAAFSFF